MLKNKGIFLKKIAELFFAQIRAVSFGGADGPRSFPDSRSAGGKRSLPQQSRQPAEDAAGAAVASMLHPLPIALCPYVVSAASARVGAAGHTVWLSFAYRLFPLSGSRLFFRHAGMNRQRGHASDACPLPYTICACLVPVMVSGKRCCPWQPLPLSTRSSGRRRLRSSSP